ncbi:MULTISPECIES: hypothetical protein [Butyricimonas]|uniref:hypothetical protein n=1 Tax=Butyricimonas TaxID=574697 RepID=UPI001B107EA9|nr:MULTISPECIES: hypothetical protein [Butyricimonas]MBO4957809.1 hypothetical protein [Butyricimonas sp.]MCI7292342.1 hypothetical protein [Butyricimonas virosa]MDY6217513.1 hypothetical protein [Butyricimonas virosa]
MEKNLFREVYKQVCGLALKDCPPSSLSGLLHGYLSVYSMVRVYPWLEDEFEGPWDIHERVREIARMIQELLKDGDIPVDTRAGYVVDLMDAYLLYSDMNFLDVALDTAYAILTPKGSEKMVLPCRTPNICRLLCNCYYFTGEEESGLLARSLVTEALGLSSKFSGEELIAWWEAIRAYESVIGEMEVPVEEKERFVGERTRLGVSVEQIEDEKIENFQRNDSDILQLEMFNVLARREFAVYNEFFYKKG